VGGKVRAGWGNSKTRGNGRGYLVRRPGRALGAFHEESLPHLRAGRRVKELHLSVVALGTQHHPLRHEAGFMDMDVEMVSGGGRVVLEGDDREASKHTCLTRLTCYL
jgi:hypothetical protein